MSEGLDAAWEALVMAIWDAPIGPESWRQVVGKHRGAIEAEAREQAWSEIGTRYVTHVEEAARRSQAVHDERKRLAGAVPLLRHAAEYLSGEFGRTGKAELNVLADRLQKLAALLQPAGEVGS